MHPGLEAAELPADAVEVGRIADGWGVKGWFKVIAHSADPQALFSSKRWYLLPAPKAGRSDTAAALLRIRQAKVHADCIVAQAHDIEDRDGADALRGARIFVARASFPTPEVGEYYWVDLLGLTVVNRQGVVLGQVSDLLASTAQTVLVVEFTQDGKVCQRLIPFVAAYVDDVDLSARRIAVDWQLDY